ncbi:MAG TPA: hypothetical protein VE715_10285 [Blastocatellia bacterium]|nr:hypothetical protein [Blastocatellia bacterium]
MNKKLFNLIGLTLSAVAASLISVAVMAQNSAGTAHAAEGTYVVNSSSPAMGALTFLLTLKKNGEKWSGEITDCPMPLTVNNALVDAENNVVLVGDLGGRMIEIKGKFEAGKITGGWSLGELKGAWDAIKKEETKPAVAAPAPITTPLTGATPPPALEGAYDLKVTADTQVEFLLTLVIRKEGDKLKTEVPSGGDLKIVDIKIEGDKVTLVATYQGQGPILMPGSSAGDELSGRWEFGGFSGTWKATKKR